jgi:ATP/maltotriose-dependent transcriptional regulator MalT
MDVNSGMLLASLIPNTVGVAPVALVIADAGGILVTGVVIFVASSLGFAVASLLLIPMLNRFGNGISYRRGHAIPIEPLLATKLRLPQARPDLVARPHLAYKDHRLTLVSAPAGFGKTTLLSQWVAESKLPVACISLDKGDNAPVRFLTYLIAALQTIQPRIGSAALLSLQSARVLSTEAILSILVNDMGGEASDFVLILDDYHVISSEAVHDIVSFLLERAPQQLHLVIASRAEPPLPLGRLRVGGQIAELRAADLRFTPAEAAVFLNRVMGLSLSPDQIAALEDRTEGWVAGLQLAALALRGRQDVPAFVGAFSGEHPFVSGYLVEEAFCCQPDYVQSFLLQTAILNRLTGSLCDAVTGRADGYSTLEALERANLFIVALDDERYWYRYHHLFADFLRARLHQSRSYPLPRLHACAARWYEQNGMIEEAVDHAVGAADFALAARLIGQPDVAAHDEYLEITGGPPRLAGPPRPDQLDLALVEPLSERELEVMQLITLGLSNQEIAQELTVSLNTVKTHIRSIYGKLDARSRTQAVKRARELNVLQ